MPSEPIAWVLDRELSKAAAREVIDVATPMLTEVTNCGTRVFARCRASARGEETVHVAPLYLYLHVVEMVDALQVLLSECCSAPADLLVRSAFEALISLRYIVADDYRRRSLAWVYDYARSRAGVYDSLDPSSPRGKALRRSVERERIPMSLPSKDGVAAASAPILKFLQRQELQEIRNEYAACKEARDGRRPRWHALFGGPDTLEQLAVRVAKESHYQILYRHWSGVTHAHDISRFVTQTADGLPAVNPLRDPQEVARLASIAVTVFIDVTDALVGHFRPDETEYKEWYTNEVLASHRALQETMKRSREARGS